MNKEETDLSNKFLTNLKKACTEHGERIRLIKIHGGDYQEPGLSDWFAIFRGVFIGIEFKVAPNEFEQNQIDFLLDVAECGGVALMIEFVKTRPKEYSWGQEYMILTNSFAVRTKCHYHFNI